MYVPIHAGVSVCISSLSLRATGHRLRGGRPAACLAAGNTNTTDQSKFLRFGYLLQISQTTVLVSSLSLHRCSIPQPESWSINLSLVHSWQFYTTTVRKQQVTFQLINQYCNLFLILTSSHHPKSLLLSFPRFFSSKHSSFHSLVLKRVFPLVPKGKMLPPCFPKQIRAVEVEATKLHMVPPDDL